MNAYFTTAPNNLSWIKSEGQQNAKALYPKVYNWALDNVNKGVAYFKGNTGYCFKSTTTSGYWWISMETPVVGATVYQNSTGIALYYPVATISSVADDGTFTFTSSTSGKTYTCERYASHDKQDWLTEYDWGVDQTNETFRLPLLNGSEDLPSDKVTNMTLSSSGTKYIAPANGLIYVNKNASKIGEYMALGVTTGGDTIWKYGTQIVSQGPQYVELIVPVKRNDTFVVNYNLTGNTNVFRFIYAKGNDSLYYYVGETVQNANLIDAGRIGEQIVDLNATSRGYLVDSYVNGTSWYRIYSDGWCEQGGLAGSTTSSAKVTVTLLKPFLSNTYSLFGGTQKPETDMGAFCVGFDTKTTTSFQAGVADDASRNKGTFTWEAHGYIS